MPTDILSLLKTNISCADRYDRDFPRSEIQIQIPEQHDCTQLPPFIKSQNFKSEILKHVTAPQLPVYVQHPAPTTIVPPQYLYTGALSHNEPAELYTGSIYQALCVEEWHVLPSSYTILVSRCKPSTGEFSWCQQHRNCMNLSSRPKFNFYGFF
jgi:hypothetical protein